MGRGPRFEGRVGKTRERILLLLEPRPSYRGPAFLALTPLVSAPILAPDNENNSLRSAAAVPMDTLIYLATSFWIGAVHAATPGHGKTIAAAYIVGARGRPIDAVILGVFVTLSHTSGIVLVGVLASIGLPGMVPQRIEAWLALITGVLVIAIGLWTLWTQREMLLQLQGVPVAPKHSHGKTTPMITGMARTIRMAEARQAHALPSGGHAHARRPQPRARQRSRTRPRPCA